MAVCMALAGSPAATNCLSPGGQTFHGSDGTRKEHVPQFRAECGFRQDMRPQSMGIGIGGREILERATARAEKEQGRRRPTTVQLRTCGFPGWAERIRPNRGIVLRGSKIAAGKCVTN